ncbi:MAG: hypothetical protein WAK21_06425, partial [Candidatus Sulfotelmatobacter sp.]
GRVLNGENDPCNAQAASWESLLARLYRGWSFGQSTVLLPSLDKLSFSREFGGGNGSQVRNVLTDQDSKLGQ